MSSSIIWPDLSSKKISASSSYTSRHAAPIILALIPSSSASASINAPRDVLIITTPFFILFMALLSIICLVSSVNGQCREIISLLSNNSSSVTYSILEPVIGYLSYAITFIPKPLQISIKTLPILPVPITPAVLPYRLKPVRPVKEKLKSLVLL